MTVVIGSSWSVVGRTPSKQVEKIIPHIERRTYFMDLVVEIYGNKFGVRCLLVAFSEECKGDDVARAEIEEVDVKVRLSAILRFSKLAVSVLPVYELQVKK